MVNKHVPIFFPIVFGLFDLLFVVLLVNGLVQSCRVIASTSGLSITRSWILFWSQKQIRAADIFSLNTSFGMRSGQKVYYNLQAQTRLRQSPVTLAHNLPDRKMAVWLISEMERVLKLDNTARTPSIGQ